VSHINRLNCSLQLLIYLSQSFHYTNTTTQPISTITQSIHNNEAFIHHVHHINSTSRQYSNSSTVGASVSSGKLATTQTYDSQFIVVLLQSQQRYLHLPHYLHAYQYQSTATINSPDPTAISTSHHLPLPINNRGGMSVSKYLHPLLLLFPPRHKTIPFLVDVWGSPTLLS